MFTAAHGGHDDHHAPFLAHHFEDHGHQFDSGKHGIWAFLGQELLFFSGLFCAYVIYRGNHPEIFLQGSYFLDVKWGAVRLEKINTQVFTAPHFTSRKWLP